MAAHEKSHFKSDSHNLENSSHVVSKFVTHDLASSQHFKESPEVENFDDQYNLQEMLKEDLRTISQKLNSENFGADFQLP